MVVDTRPSWMELIQRWVVENMGSYNQGNHRN